MSNTAYRSDDHILQARRQDLLEKRWAARADVETLIDVGARQAVRKIAGAAGVLFTLLGLVGFAFFVNDGSDHGRRVFSLDPPTAAGLLTLGVFAVPALTALLMTSGRALRAMTLRRTLKTLFAPTEDVRADVTRLETASDLTSLRDRLMERAGSSFALPFSILAVFAPLLLHFVVFAAFSAFAGPNKMANVLETFDQWVIMSLGLMALSYLVLVVRVFGFANRARTVESEHLARVGSGYGFATLGLTSLAACIPGALLFFIPPVVSFLTGLALLPAMFAGYGVLIRRERLTIEAAFQGAT